LVWNTPANQKNRDSFACDLMEAIRPHIDAYVLELVRSRPFGAGDFFETRQGACRLMPPVTRTLAETAPQWAAAIGPVAEGIARMPLTERGVSPQAAPTPLTEANRSAGCAKVRTRPPRATAPALEVPAACHECGVILSDPNRKYCDDCLPEIREEQGTSFAVTGPTTLAARRAAGTDPAHGGNAGKSRGHRNAKHHAAVVAWEHEEIEKPKPEQFTRIFCPCCKAFP